MAFILLDRVQETATANTTVSFSLAGAVAGFEPFSAIGSGSTTYYSATDASGKWEVGVGTYNSSGNLLVRTTPYLHTGFSLGAEPAFSGTVTVFITYLANTAVYLDPSSNVSALGTISSGTWQGSTIGVAYGGTGVTTSSGPNSLVLRDANENITVNRLSQGLQTITASGGVTTLTAASDFNQQLVGTGGHTFRLPDATTLTDTTTFQFNNNATGTLTIQNNAATTVGSVAPGGAAGIALMSNATVGGTWDVHGYVPENVTWGTNSLYLASDVITGGTWNGGTIQSGYGGTGLTTFAGANNALYSTSASALAAGTLPVAAGGTGLTSYTLNGVVYASGTGTLATGSALTFNGTNLGLGTTPSYKLHVAGPSGSELRWENTDDINRGWRLKATTGVGVNFGTTSGVYPLLFDIDSVTKMTLDTSGNLSMAAAGAIVSSRINPRTSTTTSTATLTPDIQAADQYNLTAQAVGLTVAAPTGTPVDGNKLLFRILDNGSAQTITWNATYTAIGVTLPTATTASKMVYVGCIYNSTNARWDVIAVATQA